MTARQLDLHPFVTVEAAVGEIRAGRPVVVVDALDRENEGDLVFAAQHATPELLAFTIRYGSGVVCVPMAGAELDRLGLPPMVAVNEDRKCTAFSVSVDARDGIDTGISAADRAHTIRRLAEPATTAADLSRPGHVFPLRAVSGGVLERAGHTEAAVDLARLAGLRPAGVVCELVADDGSMARLPQLVTFCRRHGLGLLSIAELRVYLADRAARRAAGAAPMSVPAGGPAAAPLVEAVARTPLPTEHGLFRAVGYRHLGGGREHIALVAGDVADADDVLVRVHSECLTGDVFGSLRCDCGPQLRAALAAVAAEGRGVVVYAPGHEGRGIGLLAKLRAYALQDAGSDTVDANLALGLPADARDYAAAAAILADLRVRSVRLLTNNPAKVAGLAEHGVRVRARVPIPVTANPYNVRYLATKRDRMGHLIELPEAMVPRAGAGRPAVAAIGTEHR